MQTLLSLLGLLGLCSILHLLGDTPLMVLGKLGICKGKGRGKVSATLLLHCFYADILTAIYVGIMYHPLGAVCVVLQHYIIDIALNKKKTKALTVLDQCLHMLSIFTIIGIFA